MQISVHGKAIDKVVEIHSLFLHPRLRGQRLAPMLITEIGKRCAMQGIQQVFLFYFRLLYSDPY